MSTIPRLLRRPLLRAPIPTPFTLRYASTQHQKTLAKPSKFTPPSHPSSRTLPRDPMNYPGPPTPPRDPTRRYPNTMPPPNTWAHFFLTSKTFHFYISMGILVGLAGFVSVNNFLNTSPYAKSVYWDWWHPRDSIESMMTAIKQHVEAESVRVGEMRKRKTEDIDLRGEYRRAHGLERSGDEGGFGGWAVKRSGREPGSEGGFIPERAPGLRRGDWVEDHIREAEEEAAKLVEDAKKAAAEGTATPAVATEEPAKKKKSSWW